MSRVPIFNAQHLTAIAQILAETNSGLTGPQLGYLLKDSKIPDVSPDATKWKRLFNAFVEMQNSRQFGNHVVIFITKAMNPVQYTSNREGFESMRDALNVVLAFSGFHLGEDGKVRYSEKAHNLTQAEERASRLRSALVSRKVHQDVLVACKAEWLQSNYFHAVFEAMKSVAVKIRRLSGLTGDGTALVEAAFALKSGTPILAINSLSTETHKGEQRGFVNLLNGLFGTIRNPLAHHPKLEWDMDEQDALDILTTLSLVHRKLDKATNVASAGSVSSP